MRFTAFLLITCAALGATSPDEELRRILATPITFFGKVVDEAGNAVPDAQIKLTVGAEERSYQYRTSDEFGRFELHGSRGLSLAVWVSKDGYYSTKESRNHFVYGGVRGGDEPINPTPGAPAIFVLKKMGVTHPLIYLARKTIKVPKDGTHGYVKTFESRMEKNARPWRRGFENQFFAKLQDGRFAWLKLSLITAGDHFFVLESYLNPVPGNRNLEFDPEKALPAIPRVR